MKFTACVLLVFGLANGLVLEKQASVTGVAEAKKETSQKHVTHAAKRSAKLASQPEAVVTEAELRMARQQLCGRGGLGQHRSKQSCDEQLRRACELAGPVSFVQAEVPSRVVKALCLQLVRQEPEEEAAAEGGDEEAAAEEGAEDGEGDDAEGDAEEGDEGGDEEGSEEAEYGVPTKQRRPLPEQGFHTVVNGEKKHGDLVEHVSKETATEDWQQEFGPKAGHRSYKEICREHPNNKWCRLHRFTYDDEEEVLEPEYVHHKYEEEVIPAGPALTPEEESHHWHVTLLVVGLTLLGIGLLVGLVLLYQGGYLCPSPGVRVLTN